MGIWVVRKVFDGSRKGVLNVQLHGPMPALPSAPPTSCKPKWCLLRSRLCRVFRPCGPGTLSVCATRISTPRHGKGCVGQRVLHFRPTHPFALMRRPAQAIPPLTPRTGIDRNPLNTNRFPDYGLRQMHRFGLPFPVAPRPLRCF